MNNLNEDNELTEESLTFKEVITMGLKQNRMTEQDIAAERLAEARDEALDEAYTDWLSDNIDDRRKEYIEEYCQDDFNAYCKVVYKQER